MGAKGSNLSRSQLDILQQSITKINQDLRSKAENDSYNNAYIEQIIRINNESGTPPCQPYIDQNTKCKQNCIVDSRPPIYQCQWRNPTNLKTQSTNKENCDAIYGTYEDSINDSLCGSPQPQNPQRENQCINKALRLQCPLNPPIYTQSDTPGCLGGYVQNGQCFTPLDIGGYTSNNCNCGKKTYIRKIIAGGEVSYVYKNGTQPITQQTYPSCVGNETDGVCEIELDGTNIYSCNQVDPGGINHLEGKTLSECYSDCSQQNRCPTEVASQPMILPTISCNGPGGGLCLVNDARVTIDTQQLADSTIESQFANNLSNDFSTNIIKEISQTNEGFNFQQFNNSDEYTRITQTIKNIIHNTVQTESQNVSTNYTNNKQIIDVNNKGNIYGNVEGCSRKEPDYSRCESKEGQEKIDCQREVESNFNVQDDCIDTESGGSGCGCKFTNKSVQELKTKQEAKSILNNIFDNTLVNSLMTDYTLTVDQLNKNTFDFLFLIIAAIIIGMAIVFKRIIPIIIAVVVLGVLFGAFYAFYYYYWSQSPVEEENAVSEEILTDEPVVTTTEEPTQEPTQEQEYTVEYVLMGVNVLLLVIFIIAIISLKSISNNTIKKNGPN